MPKLIGITGPAGSGKDTLADLLKDHLPQAEITSFAEPIRTIAHKMGLPIHDREKKEKAARIRYAWIEDSLIQAFTSTLGDYLGADDLADLYATFITILESRGYITRGRQDVLEISPREFCQLLGTEAGHSVRRGLWVDILKTRILRTPRLRASRYILVPDARFPHEAAQCSTLVYVDRPGTERVRAHASENHFGTLRSMAQHVVHNDASLVELEAAAANLAETLP